MKKKFNLKLTISLVSLFISLLILILFNQNKFGLFFGFLLLGCALFLYGYYRSSILKTVIDKTNEELEENSDYETEEEVIVYNEVLNELKRVKRMKRSAQITFYLAGALVILIAILMLF